MKVPKYLESTLKKRYLQPSETPEGMIRRTAEYVARAECYYKCNHESTLLSAPVTWTDFQQNLANEWFTTMDQGYWLPSSPFLMNAGTKVNMLSACFVCGLKDSMESIFDTLGKAALIWKTGGGTGFEFNALRSEGATINSTGGTSTGPLAFMEIYNSASNGVKQGGRRRAASMGVLRIDHPDILKFIRYKSDLTKLTNFNISVAITDKFMQAVKNREKFDLIEPSTNQVVGTIDAFETFKEIAYRNWLSGEPGVLFIDTVNRYNTVLHLGQIRATNPCGEIPLLPWEACNLASINVERFVIEGKMDWSTLERIVRLVVRFLDNAIDVNELPLPQIEEAVERTRKLGLGIMGLHGALIRMGVAYDSAEGREIASAIMGFVNTKAHEYSAVLAEERGNFPAWEGSSFEKARKPMRNATLTTIAPTGTISMINGASSSGLEPIFTHAYRRDIEGTSHDIVVPVLEEVAKKNGFWSQKMVDKVIANQGKVFGIAEIPEHWQKILKTAMEISPEDHVLMQSALQVHVDNSISKTINLPNNATVDDVLRVYTMAYDTGCKGCTVYRDGSRDSQVLYTGSKDDKKESSIEKKRIELQRGEVIDAPESAPSVRIKVRTGCGKLYLIISYDINGDIIETFIETGSDGGCEVFTRSTSRLISLALRGGISLEKVVDQLNSAGKCASYMYQKGKGKDVSPGKSCPSAIGIMLLDIQKKIKSLRKLGIDPSSINDIIAGVDMTQSDVCKIDTRQETVEDLRDELLNAKTLCPECKTKLRSESGCVVCANCGFSKCD